MKLDSRIKALSDILTCFDIENAGQFIGQKGYFADALGEFKNLKGCKYGELVECECDSYYPYWCRCRKPGYAFYIPESILKPEEKIDEISILKYKIEKLEKNLIELKHELSNQKTIYNPFASWTCASINYSDGFNPQANCCSNK